MFTKQSIKKPCTSELEQARDVLRDCKRVMKSKVRTVAAKGDRDGYALALYTLAAGHRFAWTPDDWAAVLNKLDDCEDTVSVWLEGLADAADN